MNKARHLLVATCLLFISNITVSTFAKADMFLDGYIGKFLPDVAIPTAALIFCIAVLGLIGISRR